MPGTLLEKLRRDEVALGVNLMYPAPSSLESMGRGWDWIWIDGQHGQMDYATILHAVQVAGLLGSSTCVRVPGHALDAIGPTLDMGADAIMVPMVNSADEAKRLAPAMYFPPRGSRSYGGRRVIDLDGRDYYKTANDRVLLICQIETLEAVEQAERIAAVEGVGALFFGPDDMKMRMGLPINTQVQESPELLKAMEKMARAARNAGKVAGIVAPSAPSIQAAAGMGYRLIVGGGDVGFLRTGSAAKLEELRGALAGQAKAAGAKPGPVSPY